MMWQKVEQQSECFPYASMDSHFGFKFKGSEIHKIHCCQRYFNVFPRYLCLFYNRNRIKKADLLPKFVNKSKNTLKGDRELYIK